jgi:hypothetical protein
MYEHGTLEPVEVILRRGKRKNNGEDEPNRCKIDVYMEMSQ